MSYLGRQRKVPSYVYDEDSFRSNPRAVHPEIRDYADRSGERVPPSDEPRRQSRRSNTPKRVNFDRSSEPPPRRSTNYRPPRFATPYRRSNYEPPRRQTNDESPGGIQRRETSYYEHHTEPPRWLRNDSQRSTLPPRRITNRDTRRTNRGDSNSKREEAKKKLLAMTKEIHTGTKLDSLLKYSRSWLLHVALFFIILLYTILGAFIFYALERNTSERESMKKMRNELQNNLQELCSKYPATNTKEDRNEFMENATEIVQGFEDRFFTRFNLDHLAETGRDKSYEWTFINSAFFCGTVYTTIGYGHITPQTTAGRAATIIYAIIGIPLFVTLLIDYGALLTRWIKKGYIRYLRCRKKQVDQALLQGGQDEFNLPIKVSLTILAIYILFGAALFFLWEDWSYFESIYFIFISLTTIGFGDFVPEHPQLMLLTFIYIIFGLSLTSMCINVVRESLAKYLAETGAQLEAALGMDVDVNEIKEATGAK